MSRQVYESWSAKDTLQLGCRLGKLGKAGDVIQKGLEKGLELLNRFPVLLLRFYRFMKKEESLSIILMSTGFLIWRRWRK